MSGRSLAIWSNGIYVGRWALPTRGAMELSYDPSWIASAMGRPLSLSLPMSADLIPLRGPEVGFFFDNLLPDSPAIRRRMRTRFRLASESAFDLPARARGGSDAKHSYN